MNGVGDERALENGASRRAPQPNDYVGDREEKQRAARLSGIFFLAFGAINVAGPFLGYVSESVRSIVGLVGVPLMVRGVPDVWFASVEGAVFIGVGIGIIARVRFAFFAAIVWAARLVVFGGGAFWFVGAIVVVWLIRGLPPSATAAR